MSVLQGEQAPRFHSVTIPAGAYTQQQHGPAAATVAAVLASAAAAAGRAQLPLNGKSHAAAAHAAAAAAAAAAAPLAQAPGGSEAGAADVQVRRHSDPTPVKGRMSEDAAQDEGGCPESATAMSSGQSPFAFVHVDPPDLAVTAELQQLQAHGPDQQETLRLLESYPLSNPSSGVPSPLPSLPLTPEQAASWGQAGPPQHSGKHSQQKLLQLLQSQHQLQQQQQHLPSGLQQQAQAAIQQQQQQQRLHQQSQADMLQQQQEQALLSQLQRLGTQDLKAGINAHVQNSRGADAAQVSQQQEQVQDDLGEVYTPFDSPFYQDLSWAPCASISGLDSTHASFSAQNSSSVGVAQSVQASDSGGVSSPFIQQLRSAVMGAAAAAEAVPASAASASVLPVEGSFSQFDAPVARLVSEPVLRQALTIEYRAGMTPMAAAAMEAVSVHAGSRRSSGPPSLPVSRLSSAHTPAAAAADGSGSPEQAAAGEPAAAGLGLQLDVAAAADVGPVAGTPEGAAAASVVLAEPSAKSPGKTPPGAGSVAQQTDQQPPLRMWRSHMDVPQGVRCSTAGDSEGEPVQRPPWMRLLGLRRSVAGGSLSSG